MIQRTHISCLVMCLLAVGLTTGCGDDPASSNTMTSENGGSGGGGGMVVDLTMDSNKSGPQSLSGFTWLLDPVTVNGFMLQLGFSFGDDMVMAQNTCEGVETVETSAPIEYSYKAVITQDAYEKVGDDDNNCEVSISKSSFDFKIDGGQLVVTADGMTQRFSPEGTTSGLYGTWAFSDGDFTLRWAIGNGVIRAEADCTKLNGLKVTTQAPATFENYVEFLQDARGTNAEDTCEVTISKGKLKYYFDGPTLVLSDTMNGGELRLTP